MKIFKHRNLMGILFCVMLSLPFLSVIARTGYTIVNKNAYQSYSDTVTTTTTKINSGDSLNIGLLYTVAYTDGLYTGQTFYVLDGKTNIVDLFFPNETWTVNYFTPSYETTRTRLIVYDTNGNQHNRFLWQNNSNTFYFVSKNATTLDNAIHNYNIYSNTYKYDTLDNAFEYSVNKIIDNNNFGKINFTQWLFDLVLDSNQQNNLYVHFFNWYLNYTLFVSGSYILFLVLMWFINFARRLLERGMNYDF